MSNSKNLGNILNKYLSQFEKYISEFYSIVNNYLSFYETVQTRSSLFEKCKSTLPDDEKETFDFFMFTLMSFNYTFTNLKKKQEESSIQAIKFVIGQYQKRIQSLKQENERLMLEKSDFVLSNQDSDKEQHEKSYKDPQFEQILQENSSLQKEIEDLKKKILDQQRTIESLQDQNPGDDYKQEYLNLYKEHEKISEENQSLRAILEDFQKQCFNENNEALKQKNSYYDQKIKGLIDDNEVLKQIMKFKEDKLNNEINELKQNFEKGAEQYQQLSDENKSIKEIAAGQEHEIERLIGENKKLENKYNDLNRDVTH